MANLWILLTRLDSNGGRKSALASSMYDTPRDFLSSVWRIVLFIFSRAFPRVPRAPICEAHVRSSPALPLDLDEKTKERKFIFADSSRVLDSETKQDRAIGHRSVLGGRKPRDKAYKEPRRLPGDAYSSHNIFMWIAARDAHCFSELV